jgi:hypothetical protein
MLCSGNELAPGGIFSISLSGPYSPEVAPSGGLLAPRVMAGLYRAFPHVTVVTAGQGHYAWASGSDLGLTEEKLDDGLAKFLEAPDAAGRFAPPMLGILPDAIARRLAAGCEPIGEADMQIVPRMSVDRLYHRYYRPRP